VDEASSYRYYDVSKVEKARVIMRLRQMEFSIEDIATVLGQCTDEADILNHLESQKAVLQQRIQEDRDIVRSLNEIITREKSARQLLEAGNFAVEEKTIEPMLIAGIRMKGRYSECGAGFARLGKASEDTFAARRSASITTGSIAKTMRTLSRAFRSERRSRRTASPYAR
jgi:DNA-binding transcriptional MerR regulator